MQHSLLDLSHSLCYPQSNWAPLVLIPECWAYAHSRPLWVSGMNSPVRLGISPAAASTLTGVFSQRFEALFPGAGAQCCEVCFAPPLFLQVYLHANVGPRDLLAASGSTACPICSTIRHLSGFASRQVAMSPICPVCPFPPLLLVWMNVSSLSPWLWDFHAVRYSVSSGCFLF